MKQPPDQAALWEREITRRLILTARHEKILYTARVFTETADQIAKALSAAVSTHGVDVDLINALVKIRDHLNRTAFKLRDQRASDETPDSPGAPPS